MCSFAASALAGDANTYSILGNILTAMVNSAKLPEQEKIDTAAYEIVRELLLEALPKNTKFPEWETVKMASNHMESFCTIMEHTLALKSVQEAGTGIPAAFNMNMWIAKGKQFVRTVDDGGDYFSRNKEFVASDGRRNQDIKRKEKK